MKKLLLIFVVIFGNFVLNAATLPFRLGRILAAEVSRRAAPLTGLEEHAFEFDFKDRAYAVTVVKLQPGRTLSIYDFSLEISDKSYPCVALRSGSGTFDAKEWILKKTSPDDTYSMLFIVDSTKLGGGSELKATLVYDLSQKGQRRVAIPLKNLGNQALTAVSEIPASGVFQEKTSQP